MWTRQPFNLSAVVTLAGTSASAGGGGSGEYVELNIASPSATYTYTVGAAGAAGAAGSTAGSAGGTGIIIVREFYKFAIPCAANDNLDADLCGKSA